MARARHRIGMDSKAARGKVSLVIKIMKTLGEPSSSNMIRDTFNSTYRNGISMNELTQLLTRYSKWFRKVAQPSYPRRTTTWALMEGYNNEE